MKPAPARLVLASTGFAALVALSGCIPVHKTVDSDVDRVRVSFASDRAGRVFYETLSRTPARGYRTEKRASVNLLFIDVEERIVSGPNRIFNDAVSFADTNQDGTITEAEADIFASAWPSAKR